MRLPEHEVELDYAYHTEPYEHIGFRTKCGKFGHLFIDDAPVPDYNDMQRACAEVMVDAVNTANLCGRKASELAGLVRELRVALQNVVRMDDAMNDPENEYCGTTSGAYYAYYKGESATWGTARAALAATEDFA